MVMQVKITKEQKETIIRWRWVGMSYRKIGKEIGVSYNTIRNYCKEQGIK
ncbi:hypothetical protein ES702_02305 [subsurface metagenome]